MTLAVLLASAVLFGGATAVGNRSRLVPTRWAGSGELGSLTISAVVFVLVLAMKPSLVETVLLGCGLGVVLPNLDRREERENVVATATIETVMHASWLTLIAVAALGLRSML